MQRPMMQEAQTRFTFSRSRAGKWMTLIHELQDLNERTFRFLRANAVVASAARPIFPSRLNVPQMALRGHFCCRGVKP